jgi:molecular chaperone GrpE
MSTQKNEEQNKENLELIKKLESELAEMKDIAQRARADLQNYKKKSEEERSGLLQLGQIQVATDLLPVLDNFTRAIQHIPTDIKENDWTKGIIQIEKQLQQILSSLGIEQINSIGKPFDPNLHEIIGTAEGEKDIIITEIEKGYTYKGKLLRASKVLVGK